MNIDLNKIDRKLKNKLINAFTETSYNVFGLKLPKRRIWSLILALQGEIKPASKKIIEGLFLYAQKDLEASELLYQKEIYAPAVYHLQQCVEKLTKAFCLWSGFVSEKELYYRRVESKNIFEKIKKQFCRNRPEVIGHISPKAFVLILKKRFSVEYAKFLYYSTDKSELGDLDKRVRELEKLINKKKKLSKISSEEISVMIKMSVRYQGIIEKNLRKREFKLNIKRFEKGFRARLEKYLEYNIRPTISIGDIERVFLTVNDLLILYPLSIITFPHFTYTRYPSKDISIQDYNENLGIISSLPEIILLLENSMKKLPRSISGA